MHFVSHKYLYSVCLGEVKYSEEIYDLVNECFDALPLAAIVNDQFFCVHGGLSPDLKSPEDVNKVKKKTTNKLICYLMTKQNACYR